jgi:hypothetical protein
VVGSSVAKSLSSASTPASVRRLSSVDLPALVYPTMATVGSGTCQEGAPPSQEKCERESPRW